MGVIVYKANIGTSITGPEGKQRLLLAIGRLLSIFYNGSIKTINMAAKAPVEIVYKIPNRAQISVKTREFNQGLISDLVQAETFEISVFVAVVQIRFVYDKKIHMENAVSMELRTEYKENMTKLAMGFITTKNIIATMVFFERGHDRIERTYDLSMNLFRKFLGDTLISSINRINVEKYNRDFFYFNLLGFEFVIKRKYL
ncbi:MAG: hypothetical protein V1820_00560 [archaeon]